MRLVWKMFIEVLTGKETLLDRMKEEILSLNDEIRKLETENIELQSLLSDTQDELEATNNMLHQPHYD